MNMNEVIETWQYHNKRTIEFLLTLNDSDLNYKPLGSSKTLGCLLSHVADVREVYLNIIEFGGGVTWDDKRNDSKYETSIELLKEYYYSLEEKYDKIFQNGLEGEKVVDWEEMENPTVKNCIQYMIEHEIYHQGIYSIYIQGLNIDFHISP